MAAQTAAGERTIWVIDQDAERTAALCERLEFLKYSPKAGTVDSIEIESAVAVVAAAADDIAALRETNPHIPILSIDRVTAASPDAAEKGTSVSPVSSDD